VLNRGLAAAGCGLMKCWLLYPVISAPMPFQMALDEILFRRLESTVSDTVSDTPALRFYYSSEPWMTVGYAFKNGELKKNQALKICRRITGGGSVTHGNDLIFSLATRKEHDDSFASVRLSYLKIHEAVKCALDSLGKNARFYRCDENLPKGKDCFRFPIATDLALGEEKVAGGAQKRSSGVMLHQESVKIPKGVSPEVLMKSVEKGFCEVFNIQMNEAWLTPELLHEAGTLAKVKYERA